MRRRQLIGLGAAAAAPLLLLGRGLAQPAPREIEIAAQRFRFTPNRIPLKAGEAVLLKIRALDFAHGFFIPDLDRRMDLIPGRVVEFGFTAPGPGTLHFLCDNFCGDGHEGMDGAFEITA
ncbi:MAG: cupredoxin domain-containing protein [Pelomonas sp.]|nr:cupredoxin domain-containing protein [Roseateles sp.]